MNSVAGTGVLYAFYSAVVGWRGLGVLYSTVTVMDCTVVLRLFQVAGRIIETKPLRFIAHLSCSTCAVVTVPVENWYCISRSLPYCTVQYSTVLYLMMSISGGSGTQYLVHCSIQVIPDSKALHGRHSYFCFA